MQKIGSVIFSELPPTYQDQFLSGNVEKDTQFYPFQPAEGTAGSAFARLLFYGIPTVGILYLIPNYLLPNRERLNEQVSELVAPQWQGATLALLFSIGLSLLVWMLWQTWRAWRNLRVQQKIKPPSPQGDGIFGILIDSENFVVRHGDPFAEFEYAFIPQESIIQSFTSSMRFRHQAEKVSRFIDVVRIRFANHEKITEELVFKEEFALTAEELHQIINDWHQV